jgi:hypothetical protein
MTDGEVRRVLGVRADGWVRAGTWWEDRYSLLGVRVRYHVAVVEVAGERRPGLVVEEVQISSPLVGPAVAKLS